MLETDNRQEIIRICRIKQKELGLDDELHTNRLLAELKEMDAQMEHDYFFDLYKKRCKFSRNENNLFVARLLGLVDDFNIHEEAVHIQGEFPDIDTDFLPIVRDYLKTEWAPQEFGVNNVCAIGNYTTFGIKSSLLDMARVHGKDKNEIQQLTTKIGLKDDDGKAFTWDKALEQYPDLKLYCEQNPDVAESAKKLLNRNRGSGMHAAGLIIANRPIDTLIPLVRGKDGAHVSAFVEGLHGTDLGPMGLIKFDLLAILDLLKIARACKLIKDRHGLTSICALPGQSDWSDTSYLDDPKALAMANEGKLKCIFQFDSEGIRELVRRGGVDRFDDMVAYSALYRPGPMGMGMHDVYVKRKRGHEQFEIHPVLKPILGPTYGVMVFQEQVMKILRAVGNVPDMHCEIVRKAISKKKDKIFGRYKEMFLKNGQVILGWTLAEVQNLWDQIAAFAEYGFNKSHSVAYTYLSSRGLWLKAHYPLEFFAAVLSCEKEDNKIKEYKREVEEMGIPINRVSLNNSKVKFDIVDEAIYMGFANIKGIGEEIAEKVVANQPYTSFEDFLHRFGTDAKVIKPLIALRVFEGNPMALYEYYEYYKAEHKKELDRDKRYEATCVRLAHTLEDILNPQWVEVAESLLGSDEGYESDVEGWLACLDKWSEDELGFLDEMKQQQVDELKFDMTCDVLKKYRKSKASNLQKKSESSIVKFEDFIPDGNVPPDVKELLCEVPQIAENEFYGFSWKHLLESSLDYQGGWTFSDFDEDETQLIRAVEIHIIEKPKTKKSKKGNEYYTVMVEDANSRPGMVTFWKEDYDRFKEEIEYWESNTRKGNFLCIRLKRPEVGFKSYTFESPSKQNRWKEVPKEKEKDHRIIVLSRPTILEEFEKVPESHHDVLITTGRVHTFGDKTTIDIDQERLIATQKIYEFGGE